MQWRIFESQKIKKLELKSSLIEVALICSIFA